MGTVGIIANPASGKDVRRLVARASVFDNQEKQAIVLRALAGVVAAGSGSRIAYLDDTHGITRNALAEHRDELEASAVVATRTATAMDSASAARALRELDCKVIITLGGDGTNRAVASGWTDAPLIPISTGTNNVFPVLVEATVAGAAAGLIAADRVAIGATAHQAKRIRVDIEGEQDDLALVDVVLSSERFVGSRALLEPRHLKTALLARADPAAVGITALGGLIDPLPDAEDAGLLVHFGPGEITLNAPIAPGHYRAVAIRTHERVALAQTCTVEGPGVLAFDGERERVLKSGQKAHLSIDRCGPWVIDVRRALELAAREGCLRLAPPRTSTTSQ